MIYADPSFLFSLYAWDENNRAAQATYAADARRPLWFTPWQRLELRNAVRLAAHRFRRAGQTVPFRSGNVFKRLDQDLADGLLRHHEPNWRETLRLAEELSERHTELLGTAAVDLWHVSAAVLLGADSFWTFDGVQQRLAAATGKFRNVPVLKP